MSRCADCYFFDVCSSNRVCSDYTPVVEQDDYNYIDNLIEDNRARFYDEWIKYISFE